MPDFAPERSSLDDGADRVGVAALGSARPARRYPRATPSSTSSTTRPACAGSSRRPVPTSRRCRARTTSRFSPHSRAALPHRLADRPALHGRPRRCALCSTASTRCSESAGCAAARSPPAGAATASASTRSTRPATSCSKPTAAAPSSPATSTRMRSGAPPEVADPRLVAPRPPRQRLAVRARADLLAPNVLRGWRGPRSARLDRSRREGPRPVARTHTRHSAARHRPAPRRPRKLDEFQPVRPDLAVELDLSLGDQPAPRRTARRARPLRPRLLQLREVPPLRRPAERLGYGATRATRRSANRRSSSSSSRTRTRQLQFLKAADRIMTGRVGKWGVPEAAWPRVRAPATVRRRRNATSTKERSARSGSPSTRRHCARHSRAEELTHYSRSK